MMLRAMQLLLLWTFLLGADLACGQPALEAKYGNIEGTVTDSQGLPLPDLPVRISPTAGSTRLNTDATGRYEIENLAVGEYVITIGSGARLSSRRVSIDAVQRDVEADFVLPRLGSISGVVLDDEGEPLVQMPVLLMSGDTHLGVTRYVYVGLARTDGDGRYIFADVASEASYRVLVKPDIEPVPSLSAAPADIVDRATIFPMIYYPGSRTVDGAQLVRVEDGSAVDNINFRMVAEPSYCIQGVTRIDGRGEGMSFRLRPADVVHGMATFRFQPYGESAPDGSFRVCGVARGDYVLTAYKASGASGTSPHFGRTAVSVTDDDVTGVLAETPAALNVRGSIAVPRGREGDTSVSITRSDRSATVSLRTFEGFRIAGVDQQLEKSVSVPGEFSFTNVRLGEYEVAIRGEFGDDAYVKDVLYGGTSVNGRPLPVGSALAGAQLDIVIGTDGGRLVVNVVDEESQRVSDAYVYVIPEDVASVAQMATTISHGRSNQYGTYTSNVLPPGRFFVVASKTTMMSSFDDLGILWRGRSAGKLATVSSGGREEVAVFVADLFVR